MEDDFFYKNRDALCSCIFDARLKNAKETCYESGLKTHNSYPYMKNDFTNTNIIDKFCNVGNLNVYKIRKGCEICFFKDKDILYTVNRKANINSIKQSGRKGHYMYTLVSINGDSKPLFGQQTMFEEFTSVNISPELYNMLGEYAVGITKYRTIIIDDKNRDYPTISLGILNKDLELIKEIELGRYVDIEYTDYMNNEVKLNETEKEVEVSLKKDKLMVEIKKLEENKKIN